MWRAFLPLPPAAFALPVWMRIQVSGCWFQVELVTSNLKLETRIMKRIEKACV